MFKKIIWSLALQVLGTLSSFLLVLLITRSYGISAQGHFAIVKSWVDVCMTAFSLGLPQSYIYAINQLGVSIVKLKTASVRYVFFVFPVVFIVSYIWGFSTNEDAVLLIEKTTFISLGIVFLVGYSFFRGILLTKNDGKTFAIISAMPALLLFLFFVLNALFYSQKLNIELNYFLSAALAFVVMLYLLKDREVGIVAKPLTEPVPWRPIIHNGIGVFLQGVALTLLPMITYQLMLQYGYDKGQIGQFNIVLYSYLIFAMPLNMISPLFYNKWSKLKDTTALAKAVNKYLLWVVGLVPIICIMWFMMPAILVLLFGEQIQSALKASQILLFSTVPLFLNNILVCALYSRGAFKEISYMLIGKVSACLLFILLFFNLGFKTLEVVSIAWLLSDILYLVMLWHLKRVRLCA